MDAQLHTTSWAVEHFPIITTENMTTINYSFDFNISTQEYWLVFNCLFKQFKRGIGNKQFKHVLSSLLFIWFWRDF